MNSVLLSAAGVLFVVLQGCDNGENHSSTQTPASSTVASTSSGTAASSPQSVTLIPPTSTRFTTPPPKSPRAPLSGQEIADLMNQDYHGFKADDTSSSYGVYIRSTESTKVYCHGSCFRGMADCRVSGSVFNNKVMVTEKGTLSWGFGNSTNLGTGYFVNRTEVSNHIGKCAYAHDGGTDYRFNMGCGCLDEKSPPCEDPAAAFWSLDPETNYSKPLTDESPLVDACSVANLDPGSGFWKGPAFYRPTGFPKQDEMFKMLQWRAEQLSDKTVWNEMVLDGEAMLERLVEDPASVVPAIVYVPSASRDAKTKAMKMAKEFSEQWNLPSHIPVIKIDSSVVVTDGVGKPFKFEHGLDAVQV